MPYPYFLELITYYNDPKSFFNPKLTEEQLEEKKDSIHSALERLRSQ